MTGIEVPLDSSRDMRQQSGLHYCLVSSCLHGHGKPDVCPLFLLAGPDGFPGMPRDDPWGFPAEAMRQRLSEGSRLGAPPSRLPGHGGEDRGRLACHCLVPAEALRR